MPQAPTKHLLIVKQCRRLSEAGEAALQVISSRYGIDAYTARQRLLGPATALLGQGPPQTLGKIAAALTEAGLQCWISPPRRPSGPPEILRGLEIGPEHLLLRTQRSEVRLPHGGQLLAVLGDVSGRLVAKRLKRTMAHNLYRGTEPDQDLDERETVQTILQGEPLLDIFQLNSAGEVLAVIRARPAKFDPSGLEEHKSLSSRGNLLALIDLLRQNAGRFQLDTAFGVAQLPGSKLQREADGAHWQEENARNLLRYGWQLSSIAGKPSLAASGEQEATPGAEILARTPGLKEIVAAIHEGDQDPRTAEEEAATQAALPQPPGIRHRRTFGISGIGITIAVVVWAGMAGLSTGSHQLGQQIARYGFGTGLLPGLLTAILLGAGLHYLRLKRKIENTPTSKVRSLAMGLVELHGTTRRQFALVAPMTQTACVYYRLRHYKRRRDREDNTVHWELTSDTDSGHVPFWLDDGTGRVSVDPLNASIRAGTKEEGHPGQGNILLGSSGSLDADEKWVEERIDEGTRLYVLGSARPTRRERVPLKQRNIEKLRELKQNRNQLLKFDADGDGQIDAQEWQTAREAVEDQVIRDQLAGEAEPATGGVLAVIDQGEHRGLPFIIAETHCEQALSGRFGWYSYPLLVAALGSFVWGLIQLLGFLGLA